MYFDSKFYGKRRDKERSKTYHMERFTKYRAKYQRIKMDIELMKKDSFRNHACKEGSMYESMNQIKEKYYKKYKFHYDIYKILVDDENMV